MRIHRRIIACTAALALVAAACDTGEDEPGIPGEEPTDGAPEADADTDTETDEDTDAEGDAPAGDLVTLDRIGSADAPNSFTLQLSQGHSHEAPTASTADGLRDLYQQWAEDNPDWRIDVEVVPGADIAQNMAVLLEGSRVGRAPDCAEIDSFVIAQFIEQDVLQPLNDQFDDAEIDDFFPFIQDVVVRDGQLYAFWWNTDMRVLYYRTDLMPEAPATHDELLTVAAEVADEHGVDGFLFNGGRWEATTFDNLAHFWAAGGDLVDDDGRPVFGEGANRDAMITTFEFLREAVDSGASPEAVATIMEYEEFNTAAQAGTVASFLGGHWQYGQLQDALDADEFELWDFAPIPAPEGGQHTTGTGGWTFGVFTDDPEVQAACMDFVRSVYYGPANVVANQLPTSASLYDEYEEFDQEHYQRFNELLEDGRARPGVPVYPELSEHLQVAIGELLIGNLTPEEAVDQAYDAALDAYESM